MTSEIVNESHNRLIAGSGFTHVTRLFVFSFIIVYFLLPKALVFDYWGGYKEVSYELSFWYLQRYVLLAASLLFIGFCFYFIGVLRKFSFLLVASLVIVVLQSYFEFYVGLYAAIGGLASVYLVYVWRYAKFETWHLRVLAILIVLYVWQYFFYSIHGRVTGSHLDPNISGYYLFLSYCIARCFKYRVMAIVILAMGVLGLSRNFMLAVIIYELLSYLLKYHYFIRALRRFKVWMITVISIILVSYMSYHYVYKIEVDSEIGGGTERVLRLNDESNYNRFMANISFFHMLSDGNFLLVGYGKKMSDESDHRPHNAFFRSIYRFGFPLAAVALIYFVSVSETIYRSNPAFILSLFAYYSFLNDFTTGNELVLLVIVGMLITSYSNINDQGDRGEIIG